MESDKLFQLLLLMQRHLVLVARSIILDANSLKGRPNDYLVAGTKRRFYPELWKVRGKMANDWSAIHGLARESISHGN